MNAQESHDFLLKKFDKSCRNYLFQNADKIEFEQALYDGAEALEKQIPKKGIMIGDNYSSILSCPNCRKPIVNVWNIAKYEPNYCHYCGQSLDWSEVE